MWRLHGCCCWLPLDAAQCHHAGEQAQAGALCRQSQRWVSGGLPGARPLPAHRKPLSPQGPLPAAPAAGGGRGRLWQAAAESAGGRALCAVARRTGGVGGHVCRPLPLVRSSVDWGVCVRAGVRSSCAEALLLAGGSNASISSTGLRHTRMRFHPAHHHPRAGSSSTMSSVPRDLLQLCLTAPAPD